jgi:pectate lyase
MRCYFFCLLLLLSGPVVLWAQEGYGAKATGGQGGIEVTVRDFKNLQHYAESFGKVIIHVEGTIKFGAVYVRSDKSIIGKGPDATLVGNLNLQNTTNNVIIQNLTISDPNSGSGNSDDDDGVTVFGAKRVWVDHCTFHDCADGCLDITADSSDVTVSWCKFYYTDQVEHRLTMLLKGLSHPPAKKEKDKKKREKQEQKLSGLRVTLHHNWWAERCFSRMPAAQYVKVHMYNNYFTARRNDYGTESRKGAEILSENNYYDGIRNPITSQNGGKLRTKGNIYKNCTEKTANGRDDVFKPSYDYSLDNTKKVPDIVRSGAGPH